MLTAFRAHPEMPSSTNILYVENAGQRILVDSGNGLIDKNEPGLLLDGLRAEGIAPDSIDLVIITHFHGDHIGGLLDGDGRPVFSKARLVVPTLEYAYWMAEPQLATMAAERAERLRKTFSVYSGKLTQMGSQQDIALGIRYVPTYGHTPGQCGVWLESEGEQLLHIADAAHTTLQLNLVHAVPKFDNQPDVATATRRAIFDRAENEHLRIMAYHFPFP